MNAETPGSQDKFRRYRAAKKAAGLREYRLWAPDWSGPKFEAEMARAAEYFERLSETHWLSDFADQCLIDIDISLTEQENRRDR